MCLVIKINHFLTSRQMTMGPIDERLYLPFFLYCRQCMKTYSDNLREIKCPTWPGQLASEGYFHTAVYNKHPGGCPSGYCTQRCENEVWHVAAKAVWDAGEYLPSLRTLVAEAAKLIRRTLDCLNCCHDGCKRGNFLIF